jgi:hypothetical protein
MLQGKRLLETLAVFTSEKRCDPQGRDKNTSEERPEK